jgi:hypothetical protein
MLVIPAAGIADIRYSGGRLRLVRFSDMRQDAAGGQPVPSQPLLAQPATHTGNAPHPERSASDTVRTLGILAIILGVWAVGLNAIRLVGAVLLGSGEAGLPRLSLATWLAAAALGALLTVSGFGLTSPRRRGTSLARFVAACQCVLGLVMIANVVWVNPIAPPGAAAPALAGAVLGRLLGMVFPVALVIVLARTSGPRAPR